MRAHYSLLIQVKRGLGSIHRYQYIHIRLTNILDGFWGRKHVLVLVSGRARILTADDESLNNDRELSSLVLGNLSAI
jgi:hypothetical protein